MGLADCGSPERLINSILKANPNLAIPVPIESLAAAVGITDIRQIVTDGFEGSLITNPEKSTGIIVLNAGSRPQRQRFTIAHEVGHFLIPTHTGDIECATSDLSVYSGKKLAVRREVEANRFASGMLLPAPHFRQDVDRLGEPDLADIFTLSDRYDTSREATANRYVEFTRYNCAFIFSVNGRIRYPRVCKGFPWLSVKKGDALPSKSPSISGPESPERIPSQWAEVPGEVWLQTGRHGERLPTVLEQTVPLSQGHRITLLQVDEIKEDEDDELNLDESWTPRFRRG